MNMIVIKRTDSDGENIAKVVNLDHLIGSIFRVETRELKLYMAGCSHPEVIDGDVAVEVAAYLDNLSQGRFGIDFGYIKKEDLTNG